jgi:hypothetical protein
MEVAALVVSHKFLARRRFHPLLQERERAGTKKKPVFQSYYLIARARLCHILTVNKP